MLTTTQLLRNAALKSMSVKIGDKTADYADVNAQAIKDSRCWLCGGQTNGQGQPKKDVIKPTFTDHDKSKWKTSQSVCLGCAFCLSHSSLRNYNIVATEQGLQHPGRAELRDILLNPPHPPFVICITTSGQKWLHFKSMINYSRDEFAVQMEDIRVGVYRELLVEIIEPVEQLYAVFSKEEILTGRYSQGRIKEIGLSEFQRLEKIISVHRGQRVFELAVFVAHKREKEEKPCITTLIPTTNAASLVAPGS